MAMKYAATEFNATHDKCNWIWNTMMGGWQCIQMKFTKVMNFLQKKKNTDASISNGIQSLQTLFCIIGISLANKFLFYRLIRPLSLIKIYLLGECRRNDFKVGKFKLFGPFVVYAKSLICAFGAAIANKIQFKIELLITNICMKKFIVKNKK